MALSTSSNFARPDDAFRALVEVHRGLSDAQSADFDAALVLILANHIGDIDVPGRGPPRQLSRSGVDNGES